MAGWGGDVERSKILELPGRLNHEEIGTPLSDSTRYITHRAVQTCDTSE